MSFFSASVAILTDVARLWFVGPLLAFSFLIGTSAPSSAQADAKNVIEDSPDQSKWTDLLADKIRDGWRVTEFGSPGDVTIGDGRIETEIGAPLLGVTYSESKFKLPRDNYEIELEARRLEGTDFFCGLTFPIEASHCTLVLGGWGGGLVGLSSIDGLDASENETTSYHSFKQNRWYRVRVRVSQRIISAWLDGKQVVICNAKDRKIDTRPEVMRSQPLGLATYQTAGEFRNVRIRQLTTD